MSTERYDVIVIGGGPAGLAAAIEASKNGAKRVTVIERDYCPGGILPQCVHSGFGIRYFGEELTGPEYAQRFVDRAIASGINFKLDTMVLHVSRDRTVTIVDGTHGLRTIQGGAVILCMGCRERTRGALNIPGARPAGILAAGAAQRLVNIEGFMPGKTIVVLGSGDIGLIMARRMKLEGADVKMVLEVLPYSSGLTRNIVQCLEDFEIPLKLSHTVIKIHGADRLEGVTIAKVGPDRKPIAGTESYVSCDTLLLSVGLIPENELSAEAGVDMDPVTLGPVVDQNMSTSVEGIFAAGNVAHVHDIVDYVSEEAARAGKNAAVFAAGAEGSGSGEYFGVTAGNGIRYVVPQRINRDSIHGGVKFYFRTTGIFEGGTVHIHDESKPVYQRKSDIMTPGEMESVEIGEDMIREWGKAGPVTFSIANPTDGGTKQ